MTRIRIVFILLALVLLASLAAVVGKARDNVAAERALRHRVLADRIIDEMERELTAWLRREEDRPFAQYRYFFVPEGSPTQLVNLSRSPLSHPPQEPFVVCYFQIDPGGRVSSPLWPDNEKLATVVGWRPSPKVRAVVDLVGEAVSDFWRTEPAALATAKLGAGAEDDDKSGGTTVALDRPRRKAPSKQALKKQLDEKEQAESEAQRRYLSSLNRGALARQQRPSKIEPSQAANVYNFLQNEANVLQSAVESQVAALEADDRRADEADGERASGTSASGGTNPGRAAGATSPGRDSGATILPTTPEIEDSITQALRTEVTATIDVSLNPMVGRLATPNHLVLYRTVTIDDETFRQGLMLDVPALVRWVSERVLAGGELAAPARVALAGRAPSQSRRVATRVVSNRVASDRGSGTYSYRHSFAEPFAVVEADVFLDPLPEVRGPFNLTTLSLLLAFAATFGLFALYRMVAVAVTYAERRNNFVSAVTHELKTPLTAIRMYGEMLRDGMVPKESKRQQYYETITAETERLTRLVQNVLELSKLEQKKRAMKVEVGDVVGVVREALALLEPHAEKQGFRLRLVAEKRLPQVRYDRDALLQVLFNLVDNALKYSRQARDKEIVLSCLAQGDRVVVTVADHGPGVSRRHLKKIFEPFYRAENELTRTSKGTGIGLALVRGLVEQMGGSVAGSNSAGGGFEVEVSLAAG